MNLAEIYQGKRVLVTGHTGFKGAWLCEWLIALGADVHGFALPPPTTPSLFESLQMEKRVHSVIGDIRDQKTVEMLVQKIAPHFVFHLAAQPLVRESYDAPVETYATNVMGTAHLLEAVRKAARPCAVVVVTSDKCYENLEWLHSYRECDAMGGHDPYSSSKGAAELVVAAYRRSYFSGGGGIKLASARAGNVIGGGDWAKDRIVPDCIRALAQGQPVHVRNRHATRPWQHVLEPLSGYLWLGGALSGTHAELYPSPADTYASAFNFGPALASNRTVADLAAEILKHWPGTWEDNTDPNAVHEARLLNVAIDKAFHLLNWSPVWTFAETVRQTVEWYRSCTDGSEATAYAQQQIRAYTDAAAVAHLRWAGNK